MSSAIAMSLDEIIAAQRQQKKREGGGGGVRKYNNNPRSGNATWNRPRFQGASNGRWRHNNYNQANGRRHGFGNGGFRAGGGRFGGNRPVQTVKLNIHNVAATVIKQDLVELFAKYDVDSISLHYDEAGHPLGTAEVVGTPGAINGIVREYHDSVLDGKKMSFASIKETRPYIRDRLHRVAGPRGPRQGGVQKRVQGGGQKNVQGALVKRFVKPSVEDLDKDLAAYMTPVKPEA